MWRLRQSNSVLFSIVCLVSCVLPPQFAHGQDARIIEGRPRLIPNAFGPTNITRAIAFSRDSARVYAAGADKVVNTWDLQIQANGKVQPTFVDALRWTVSRSNLGAINAMAVSQANNLLAIGGTGAIDPSGNIIVYDVSTKQIVRTLVGHSGTSIVSLDFSPNGRSLISVDRLGGVIVWREANRWRAEQLRKQRVGIVEVQRQPAIFLNETTVAVADPAAANSVLNWRIGLYDVAIGIRRLGTIPTPHTTKVMVLARGQNGRWASADQAGNLFVGQGAAIRPLTKLRAWNRSPTGLAFGPDDSLAVTNLVDPRGTSVLELWSLRDKKLMAQKILSRKRSAGTLAVSPNGRLLITHNADTNDLLVFNLADAAGRIRQDPLTNPTRISGRGQRINEVAFRTDSKYDIAIGSDHKRVFRLQQPELIELGDPGAWQTPDVVAGGWTAQPVAAAEEKVTLRGPDGTSATINLKIERQGFYNTHCIIPDERGNPFAIAIGTDLENGIFIYSLPQAGRPPRLLRYFRGHSGPVTSLSVASDARWLASASDDQTVRIWSLEGLQTNGGFSNSVAWGAQFSVENGRLVASRVDKAGIAFNRGLRDNDVVTSVKGNGDDRRLRSETTPVAMLRLMEQLPIYRRILLTVQRGGQVLPNPDDPSGLGRRLIVPAWEPLLTLFLDRNDEWALFTPQGYFDSSVADGADLFGWQINRRRANPMDELTPRFFRGAELQKEFERPDVIRNILRTGNVVDALQAANEPVPNSFRDRIVAVAKQVPELQILEPADGRNFAAGGVVDVVAKVTYPNGTQPNDFEIRATESLRFLGTPLERNFDAATRTETIAWKTAARQAGARIVVSIHENGKGYKRLGKTADVFIRSKARLSPKYRLNILALSSEKYTCEGLPPLEFPHDDVDSVLSLIKSNVGIYEMGTVIRMRDNEISDNTLSQKIRELEDSIDIKTTATQLLLVYVAGHGKDVDDEYFYLPTSLKSATDESIAANGIAWSRLDRLADLGLQTMFMLDTCRSGNALGQVEDAVKEEPLANVDPGNRRGPRQRSIGQINADLKAQARPFKQRGCIVVAATSEGQDAFEGTQYRGGHGAFTASVLTGIEGAADSFEVSGPSSKDDGIVTVNELVEFIRQGVYLATGRNQRPCFTPKADVYPDFYGRKFVNSSKSAAGEND